MVLLAAILGAGVGVTVPQTEQTAAVFVDDAAVTGTYTVRPCSNAWSETVASLAPTPTRHYDFAATSTPAGNTPSPGLLVCDPSGARMLTGDESVPDPVGPMSVAEATSLVLWVSITDSLVAGDLVWLMQDDGADIGLRVSGGQLELVQATPLDVEPMAVLAQITAPDGDPHLLTLSRSDPTHVRLWVDTSEVATDPTSPAGPSTLVMGARPASGASSAHAVLDEVVVLPVELGAEQVANLVAANRW